MEDVGRTLYEINPISRKKFHDAIWESTKAILNEAGYQIDNRAKPDDIKAFIKDIAKADSDKLTAMVVDKAHECLGDTGSFEWWLDLVGIPENDRARTFQLFKMVARSQFKQKSDPYRDTLIKTMQKDETQIFQISDAIGEILSNNDAEQTVSPFPDLFIECNLKFGKYHIKGIKYTELNSSNDKFLKLAKIVDDGEKERSVPILDILVGFKEGKQMSISADYFTRDFDSKLSEFCWNFFYAFAHFVNEPEVRLVERPFNPKNNQRRALQGKETIPRIRNVYVTGQLDKFIHQIQDKLKLNYERNLTSFWKKGHWRAFHDKKRYKKMYRLMPHQLNEHGYVKMGDELKRWIRPQLVGKERKKFSKPVYKVCLPEEK